MADVDVDVDAAAAAEALRTRLEQERQQLTKNQLKKQRKKLSRLYGKAFGKQFGAAEEGSMQHETDDSAVAMSHLTHSTVSCDASLAATDASYLDEPSMSIGTHVPMQHAGEQPTLGHAIPHAPPSNLQPATQAAAEAPDSSDARPSKRARLCAHSQGQEQQHQQRGPQPIQPNLRAPVAHAHQEHMDAAVAGSSLMPIQETLQPAPYGDHHHQGPVAAGETGLMLQAVHHAPGGGQAQPPLPVAPYCPEGAAAPAAAAPATIAVAAAVAAAPGGPPQMGRMACMVDLSSVMRLIRSELDTGSPAPGHSHRHPPQAGRLGGDGEVTGPATSAQAVCRRDLSQEASVISAELSRPDHSTATVACGTSVLTAPGHRAHAQQRGSAAPAAAAGAAAAAAGAGSHPGAAAPAAAAAGDVEMLQGPGEALVTQQQQQQQPKGGKKNRKQFTFGNYHGYYGYRHASAAFDDDPRLRLLRAEWFQGRTVLDVGCNEGLVTLAVASRFACRRTTGVDIDSALAYKALRNLHTMRQELRRQQKDLIDMKQARAAGRSLSQSTSQQQPAATLSGEADGSSGHLQRQQQQQQASGAQASGASFAAAVAAAASQQQGSAAQGSQLEHYLLHDDEVVQQQQQQQQADQSEHGLHQQQQQQQQQQQPQQSSQAAAEAAQQHQEPPAQAQPHRRQQQQRGGSAPRPALCPPLPTDLGGSRWRQVALALRALDNVRFVAEDWANSGSTPSRYGTILCLSVTKWVHLNFGDDGLMRLFKKFKTCLEPGGYLVLEPQPWKSYQSAVVKKHTAAVPYRDLSELRLRPEGFVQLLTQELGFELLANLNEGCSAMGFDRPMYVFRKAGPPSLPVQPAAVSGAQADSESAQASRKRGTQ